MRTVMSSFLTELTVAHQPENKRKPVIELSRNAPTVYEISKNENELPKITNFEVKLHLNAGSACK